MDLLFTKDSCKNTTLSLPSGAPVYEINTPSRNFHTETSTIRKYRPEGGYQADDIGIIEFHSFHTDICQIWGRDFLPKSASMWKIASAFTSSNGQTYTWRRKSSTAVLEDKFQNNVAVYDQSHTGFFSGNPRPAMLSISADAMQIIDEVVCTFFYIEQKEQTRRRTANSAAASSAASSAAVAAAT
ncbi:hypothetical protein PQX77_019514 [Marasmius sp. AFHP31]|nr:hypothetical protein PQX77_019514 [Marasmius sp. AFHP31]